MKKIFVILSLLLFKFSFASIIQADSPTINTDNNPSAFVVQESEVVCVDKVNHKCKKEKEIAEYKSDYINVNNYIMNPYNHSPSGGGTHLVSESAIANQGLWDQFFHNGTYNIVGLATYTSLNMVGKMDGNNYGYGTNIFAQSGHVNGFAIGGMLEVVNPFLEPGQRYQVGPLGYENMPTSQISSLSQLYLEYQIPGTFQFDIGRIFLDNPWMNSYDDAFMTSATFQGAVANYQMTDHWRLSAIATDAYQPFSSNGFSQSTVYNQAYNSPDGFDLANNATETHSYALGAVYNPTKDYTLNLWGYNFGNYTNMLYADTNYQLHLTDTQKLTLAAQTGNQNTLGMGTNVNQQAAENPSNAGVPFGSPDSYLLGAKVGYGYSYWFETALSYDGMYGPQSSFYKGGFVSPYTYGVVNDPLYTSGLAGGLIEQGAGNSYKISTTFRPFGDDLKIETAYEKFYTVSPLDSYDLDVKYKPFDNELKGLILHLWVNYTTGPATNIVNANDFLFVQGMVSYNY